MVSGRLPRIASSPLSVLPSDISISALCHSPADAVADSIINTMIFIILIIFYLKKD